MFTAYSQRRPMSARQAHFYNMHERHSQNSNGSDDLNKFKAIEALYLSFFAAISSGDVLKATTLLDHRIGIDLNGIDEENLIYLLQISHIEYRQIDPILAAKVPFMMRMATARVNINCMHASESPLMTAAGFGHNEVVRLLLQRGADLYLIDKVFKFDALIHAVKHRHSATAKLLIEAGANVFYANPNGVSALTMALEMRHIPSIVVVTSAIIKRIVEEYCSNEQNPVIPNLQILRNIVSRLTHRFEQSAHLLTYLDEIILKLNNYIVAYRLRILLGLQSLPINLVAKIAERIIPFLKDPQPSSQQDVSEEIHQAPNLLGAAASSSSPISILNSAVALITPPGGKPFLVEEEKIAPELEDLQPASPVSIVSLGASSSSPIPPAKKALIAAKSVPISPEMTPKSPLSDAVSSPAPNLLFSKPVGDIPSIVQPVSLLSNLGHAEAKFALVPEAAGGSQLEVPVRMVRSYTT